MVTPDQRCKRDGSNMRIKVGNTKKVLAAGGAAILLFSLAACGSNGM